MRGKMSFLDYVYVANNFLYEGPIVLERGQLRARSYDYKDFLGHRKRENQITWQSFHRAINAEFGIARVYRACKRYNINLVELANKGSPLDRRIVGLFQAFASEVFCSDLACDSDLGIQFLTPLQIHTKVQSLRNHSSMDDLDEPQTFPFCLVAPSFNRTALAYDKAKALLWPKLFNATYPSYLELLSKYIGQIELEEGSILPAPTLYSEKEYY